jgi:hypothetical protein
MGKIRVVPKHLQKSPLVVQKKVLDERDKKLLNFNFHYLCNQGQSFGDWQAESLLQPLLIRLKAYSSMTRSEGENNQANTLTVYGDFPQKSGFTHPITVPQEVEWCSAHICGKRCIAGHIYGNTIYVVFLDKDHQFCISRGANN